MERQLAPPHAKLWLTTFRNCLVTLNAAEFPVWYDTRQ
jgi:hypothetical protein